ncbi:HIT family Bis(5'-adenosyl)-triphosphatase [Spraguea lophii 42_110]|uniref:HIT family Bis(5'-adenosyl)-triphosphatase n=1 Tax=Spraguea lophii (strain 42_110) TaxID=1358809 RepID=S7W9V3_SPRLO|nr:HIT family Bis(5'-adenosyl)-triphosphatase [Spraguea lophii 42_110]
MDFGGNFIPQEHIIFETQYTAVFPNISPFLPYHMLVVPKRSVMLLSELTEEEVTDMFLTIQMITRNLKNICDGFTVNIQDGECAGQTVFHIHAHVVPRKNNDLKVNNEIYKEGSLSFKRKRISNEEMISITNYLKKYITK